MPRNNRNNSSNNPFNAANALPMLQEVQRQEEERLESYNGVPSPPTSDGESYTEDSVMEEFFKVDGDRALKNMGNFNWAELEKLFDDLSEQFSKI